MSRSWNKRAIAAALIAPALAFAFLGPAAADSSPVDPANPATPQTVTADALAGVQIDGVVWSQVIVGRTVYAAGSFATARPAGSAAGANTVPRANLLAFNIDTGALVTTFAPNLNGQARAITASPDGKRIYVVGDFTQVDGQWRVRAAAFDTATGALVPDWRPSLGANAQAVVATNTTVYIGGEFTMAASFTGDTLVPRQHLAAFSAATGALTSFVSDADAAVLALTVTKDGSKVVAGGRFTTLGGSDAYGLGWVDPTTGAPSALAANAQIRDAGTNSAVLSLATDGDSIYGSGYHFGSGGNIEGPFRISAATGELAWVADCHGDTYSVAPQGELLYTVSHSHYCGNMGGFPQTDPWTYYHSTAFSKAATGVNTPDIYGYPDHPGEPSPTLQRWFPKWFVGTYTGQYQAGWSVVSNDDYVVVGGEFPGVNGLTQQGLVRFARHDLAPKKEGPRLKGADINPTLNSFVSGEVRVRFATDYDRDNETLTYKLYRENETSTPIYTETITTPFWKVLSRTIADKNLTPGSTQRYLLTVADPDGNLVKSEWVSTTVADSGSLSAYAAKVLQQTPDSYWRLGEASGTAVADWASGNDQTAGAGVTRGTAGAITGDVNTASTFSGTSTGFASTTTSVQGPGNFAVEAWFKTNTTRGGKIVGFGNSTTGNSSSYDRHIYMNNQGRLYFGIYDGATKTVNTTTSYNNNQWHHVVGTQVGATLTLYVDGVKAATRVDAGAPQAFAGYWRIGGDSLNSWPSAPTSNYFAGAIDEVAVYPALSATQVREHYTLSGRTVTVASRPADSYGGAVYDGSPDLYWRFNETNGSAIADSGQENNPGTATGLYTRGGTGAITGTTNRSIEFRRQGTTNGGSAAASTRVVPPSAYTAEAWINTTSTSGGRVIGFSSSQTGNSTNYDRAVYMQNDGKLVFSVNPGTQTKVTTAAAYNNGQWHHVVATQGADGMKLYVDGAQVGIDPQTQAGNYTGYWRIAGDQTGGSTSTNLIGKFDEVAVYSRVLTAQDVAAHYGLGTAGVAPNIAPTAAFTVAVNKVTASFDATGSTDSDGTIASYAWDFGDGTTGSGATAQHTYAAAGTYAVTLTVTDDDGATGTVTKDAVAVANAAPVAAFTATTSDRDVHVDGSASADSDGTIASYAWDFGDGSTATGATADHTYAANGTFTVKLVVTDDDGQTAELSNAVTVTLATELAKDAFERTSTSGWGTADLGGAWTMNGSASLYTVGSGSAAISLARAGSGPRAQLATVKAGDVDVVTTLSFDKLSNAGNVIGYVNTRVTGWTQEYRTKVLVSPTGVTNLEFSKLVGGTETSLGIVAAGLTYAPGDQLMVRTQAQGNGTTTLRAKVWKVGTTEPTDWKLVRTDSTAELQAPAGIGLSAYLASSSTNFPISAKFDNLLATRLG